MKFYIQSREVDLDSTPPLPSTLKAVMIQTAEDLVHAAPDLHDYWDNPDTGGPVLYHEGPDYATGFGRIDAAGATRLIRERRLARFADDPPRHGRSGLGLRAP